MVLEYEKIKVGNKNITLKIVREINGSSVGDNCKTIITKLSKLRAMGIRKIDLIKNTNIIKIECVFNDYFVKVKNEELCVGFKMKKRWLPIILCFLTLLGGGAVYLILSFLFGVIVGGIFGVLVGFGSWGYIINLHSKEILNITKVIFDCFQGK